MKQQSTDKLAASLRHIILIPSQAVFDLPSSFWVITREATNTNFIVVFGLTWSGFEPTIYHTRGEHTNHYTTDEPMIYHTRGKHTNHYTTDAVKKCLK